MPHMENDRIVESTTEARAGVTGHNVRYVLLIGTLTVIVLFAILCADQGLIALACVWVFAPGHPGAFFCA